MFELAAGLALDEVAEGGEGRRRSRSAARGRRGRPCRRARPRTRSGRPRAGRSTAGGRRRPGCARAWRPPARSSKRTSTPRASNTTRMSENRMAASTPRRSIGCRVTSAHEVKAAAQFLEADLGPRRGASGSSALPVSRARSGSARGVRRGGRGGSCRCAWPEDDSAPGGAGPPLRGADAHAGLGGPSGPLARARAVAILRPLRLRSLLFDLHHRSGCSAAASQGESIGNSTATAGGADTGTSGRAGWRIRAARRARRPPGHRGRRREHHRAERLTGGPAPTSGTLTEATTTIEGATETGTTETSTTGETTAATTGDTETDSGTGTTRATRRGRSAAGPMRHRRRLQAARRLLLVLRGIPVDPGRDPVCNGLCDQTQCPAGRHRRGEVRARPVHDREGRLQQRCPVRLAAAGCRRASCRASRAGAGAGACVPAVSSRQGARLHRAPTSCCASETRRFGLEPCACRCRGVRRRGQLRVRRGGLRRAVRVLRRGGGDVDLACGARTAEGLRLAALGRPQVRCASSRKRTHRSR